MRVIPLSEVIKKAEFISNFFVFNIEVHCESNSYRIWYDYGFEGKDCAFSGALSECNRYLNQLINRKGLKDDWTEYKNGGKQNG